MVGSVESSIKSIKSITSSELKENEGKNQFQPLKMNVTPTNIPLKMLEPVKPICLDKLIQKTKYVQNLNNTTVDQIYKSH